MLDFENQFFKKQERKFVQKTNGKYERERAIEKKWMKNKQNETVFANANWNHRPIILNGVDLREVNLNKKQILQTVPQKLKPLADIFNSHNFKPKFYLTNLKTYDENERTYIQQSFLKIVPTKKKKIPEVHFLLQNLDDLDRIRNISVIENPINIHNETRYLCRIHYPNEKSYTYLIIWINPKNTAVYFQLLKRDLHEQQFYSQVTLSKYLLPGELLKYVDICDKNPHNFEKVVFKAPFSKAPYLTYKIPRENSFRDYQSYTHNWTSEQYQNSYVSFPIKNK